MREQVGTWSIAPSGIGSQGNTRWRIHYITQSGYKGSILRNKLNHVIYFQSLKAANRRANQLNKELVTQ